MSLPDGQWNTPQYSDEELKKRYPGPGWARSQSATGSQGLSPLGSNQQPLAAAPSQVSVRTVTDCVTG